MADSISSGLSGAALGNEINYAVARKTLNAARQQGDAMVSLIENAAQVGRSGGTDALGAAATGKGGQVDVYA